MANIATNIPTSPLRDGWKMTANGGYGGHFRAVQGFRYIEGLA